MTPPKFSDIGKSASDLLSKDFPVGYQKLEIKTLTPSGPVFTTTLVKDEKSGMINAEIKSKVADAAKGLTVTPTWTSGNLFNLESDLADSLVKGLKLNLNAQLNPATNQKNVKLSSEYKQDYFFSNLAMDVFKGPTVSADLSLGAEGVVAGGEVAYNVQDGKITKYATALGYSTPDYAVAFHALNSFSVFSASYFHKVSDELEAGGKATWDKKQTQVQIEVGSKYTVDKNLFLKAKMTQTGVLGLGLSQVVRPGVRVGLGASLDTARFSENAHKFGFSLTVEA